MSFGKVGERRRWGRASTACTMRWPIPTSAPYPRLQLRAGIPIWDILFGTAIYDGKHRPTGRRSPG